MAQLATRAWARLQFAYRPATKKNYDRMFFDFMAFLVSTGLSINQVTNWQLLIFMEYLHENHHSSLNIANYLAAIRANFILYGLPTAMFKDERIQMYIKSLKINRQLKPIQHTVITEDMLKEIVQIAFLLPHPEVFTSLYTFAFFSFLRISNILPHSVASFDVSRHLCKGDIFFSDVGATVLLKWSKTLQDRTETKTIAIPALGNSVICPTTAMRAMLQHRPDNPNDPLFTISHAGRTTTLTDSVARKHLKLVGTKLQQPTHLTFHMFRKGGTSWAFQHGVPLQDIMVHGTWSSNAVWTYIKSIPTASSTVSSTFRHFLHS